jgi:hypothetical protein
VGTKGLILWHVNTAAGSRGKVTSFSFQCVQSMSTGNTCDPALSQTEQLQQGEGSHDLAEYCFEKDRNPWVAEGIELHTISYLYCASVAGDRIPRHISKRLALCGVRLRFHSDTAEALLTKDDAYVSNLDRLKHRLIATHGMPPGYLVHGEVSVDVMEGAAPKRARSTAHFEHYRWCGVNLSSNVLHPDCRATVSLAFDSQAGLGTVLYAAAPVYDFSYAVHEMGEPNNELFRLLAELPLEQAYRRERDICTGSHICSPNASPMTPAQLREFEP